ncbi:hypothetical protein D3C81_1900950 [compost metagenome]
MKTSRQAVGAANVTCPNRRSEAVVRVIGVGQGLSLVAERSDADHWAKHLALDDLIVLAGIC